MYRNRKMHEEKNYTTVRSTDSYHNKYISDTHLKCP